MKVLVSVSILSLMFVLGIWCEWNISSPSEAIYELRQTGSLEKVDGDVYYCPNVDTLGGELTELERECVDMLLRLDEINTFTKGDRVYYSTLNK